MSKHRIVDFICIVFLVVLIIYYKRPIVHNLIMAEQPEPIVKQVTKYVYPEKSKLGYGNVTFYCDIGVTRSGTPTRYGSVAVDPEFVPIGTRLKFIGFPAEVPQWGMADDTGGMIKQHDLDIWLPVSVDCFEFGIIRAKLEWRKDRLGDYIAVIYQANSLARQY